MQNSIIETICSQRSGHLFRSEQLAESLLRDILAAGCAAPTEMNEATNHFLVVQDAAVLRHLRTLVREELRTLDTMPGLHRVMRFSICQAQQERYDFAYGAPTLIIIANRKGSPDAKVDAAVAATNMMLAAHALHLGACQLTQMSWLSEQTELRKYLETIGLQEQECICSCVALGYTLQERSKAPPLHVPITYV